jgi:hypothetical protein
MRLTRCKSKFQCCIEFNWCVNANLKVNLFRLQWPLDAHNRDTQCFRMHGKMVRLDIKHQTSNSNRPRVSVQHQTLDSHRKQLVWHTCVLHVQGAINLEDAG